MSFRSIIITKPLSLRIKNNNLVIIDNDEAVEVPLDDIGAVVLECNQMIITVSALSILADKNIAVFTCDNKHIPNGVLMSYVPHSRQSKIANYSY